MSSWAWAPKDLGGVRGEREGAAKKFVYKFTFKPFNTTFIDFPRVFTIKESSYILLIFSLHSLLSKNKRNLEITLLSICPSVYPLPPYFIRRLMRSSCCLCIPLIFLFPIRSMSYHWKAGHYFSELVIIIWYISFFSSILTTPPPPPQNCIQIYPRRLQNQKWM
jgi:hypothetical protein